MRISANDHEHDAINFSLFGSNQQLPSPTESNEDSLSYWMWYSESHHIICRDRVYRLSIAPMIIWGDGDGDPHRILMRRQNDWMTVLPWNRFRVKALEIKRYTLGHVDRGTLKIYRKIEDMKYLYSSQPKHVGKPPTDSPLSMTIRKHTVKYGHANRKRQIVSMMETRINVHHSMYIVLRPQHIWCTLAHPQRVWSFRKELTV